METEFDKIIRDFNYSKDVGKVIKRLFNIMIEKNLRGFCHASASILFVCLSELGLTPKLLIGEANIENKYFDHSWICLDDKVIDLAVALPLDYSDSVGPVIFDNDLFTKKRTIVEYGKISGEDYSEETKRIMLTNFTDYMDNAPFEHGLWSFVKEILNININIQELRVKYQKTTRIIYKNDL